MIKAKLKDAAALLFGMSHAVVASDGPVGRTVDNESLDSTWRLFMRTSFAVCLAACGVILAAVPVVGHHSFAAEYDANKPIKLTGSVTKVEWMNPHTYFYMDVTEPDGKVTNWALEMGSPNGLMRAGWSRNTLKIGDVVTVEGSRAKDGTHNGNARVVILASTGQRLFAASSQGNPGDK